MSQEQLGTEFNITLLQVQKYEHVESRISASHLWKINQMLDVSIVYFFDDMSQDTTEISPRCVSLSVENLCGYGDQLRDPMLRRKTLKLVRTHYVIEKPIVRKRISKMLKSIATTLSDE